MKERPPRENLFLGQVKAFKLFFGRGIYERRGSLCVYLLISPCGLQVVMDLPGV